MVSLMHAARLIRKRLAAGRPMKTASGTGRCDARAAITAAGEDAYEVICGVAGCVLKKKD